MRQALVIDYNKVYYVPGDLQNLQKAVNGFVELVPFKDRTLIFDHKPMECSVNDEGAHVQTYNRLATHIANMLGISSTEAGIFGPLAIKGDPEELEPIERMCKKYMIENHYYFSGEYNSE